VLEEAIHKLVLSPRTSTLRMAAVADLLKKMLEEEGLKGVRGGTGGELCVPGLARVKDWDLAYEFAGKFRLLVSLKSLLKNLSGSVPNRLDDLQGELSNVQQLWPEIVIGYVVLIDSQEDGLRRTDGKMWSQFFREALERIAIRKPPLWNQGLLEAVWVICFDGSRTTGSRLNDPSKTLDEGREFVRRLVSELQRREPAVELKK